MAEPAHIPAMGGGCVKGCPACPPPAEQKPKREPAVWRPMTADEREMALCLGRCRFSPGSFQKRFAHQVSSQAMLGELAKITEKQASLLRKQVWHFRRQIPGRVVALAEGLD